MESTGEELGKFIVGIYLIQGNEGTLYPKLFNKNINMPKDIIINQLRLLAKSLEDDYYPEFRNNITTINLGPDE